MACKCQGCDKDYRIDVIVQDGIWERIKPTGKPIGARLLCGSCIISQLEAEGNYGSFRLERS